MNKKEENKKLQPLIDNLENYFTNVDKHTINRFHQKQITKEDFRKKAYNYLLNERIKPNDAEEAVDIFIDQIFGYSILDELIKDPLISDIRLIDENNVRIKKLGKRSGTDIKFKNKEEYIKFVNLIAAKNRVSLSDATAQQVFTDKETSPDFIMRFDISTGYINSSDKPLVHIRKINKNKKDLDELIKEEMMNEEIKNYLIDKAKNGEGILFTGKGSSGKTTIMNALLDEIPLDCSGLVIQETEELFTHKHPELMFQHIVTTKGESKINYSLKDLAKTGLVMDLDYFVIGEIKGEEARYFLNAAYTGHKCWASVHGMNSEEAIDKLADYIKDSTDYSKTDILKMLKHISTIVFMKDYKVQEISEIIGWDNDKKELIFKRIL